MKKENKAPTLVNKRAKFEYHLLETVEVGIVLKGTEIKSIREGKVQMAEAFCFFRDGELWLKDMTIAHYSHGNLMNVETTRERKLLLSKREIKRLKEHAEQAGLTIIPVKLFFNERNYAKLEIALAKGKKLYDKRDDLKKKDATRDMERE